MGEQYARLHQAERNQESVGSYGMLELHMLESRLKEEDYMLIKAKWKLINIQDKGM